LKAKFASLRSNARFLAFAQPYLQFDKYAFVVSLLRSQQVIDDSG